MNFCVVVGGVENLYAGVVATATGWGTLKEDGKPSCILQEVEVPVLSNAVCTNETNYTTKMITDNMLCAGYPGVGKKDSCQVIYTNILHNILNMLNFDLRAGRLGWTADRATRRRQTVRAGGRRVVGQRMRSARLSGCVHTRHPVLGLDPGKRKGRMLLQGLMQH